MFLPDKEKSAAVNVQSESVNQSWAMALNAPGVPCRSSVADSWWQFATGSGQCKKQSQQQMKRNKTLPFLKTASRKGTLSMVGYDKGPAFET